MTNTEFQRLRLLAKNANGETGLSFAQKTAWVEHQIHQVTLGNIDSVACPYCGSNVMIGVEGLCCRPMGDAATTLLERIEAKEVQQQVKDAAAPFWAIAGANTIQ
jgi:hypothetical protein